MGLFHKLIPEGPERVFVAGKRRNEMFCDNKVKNSKYTPLTFIPMILITQFKSFMNIYFIIIGILQVIPGLSPVNAWSTWLPILFIFAVALIREGYDEVKLFKSDKKTNTKQFVGVVEGKRSGYKSKDFSVGDYIVLNANDIAPCDVILAFSTDSTGSCYIDTSSLDGETTLKRRHAIKVTQELGEFDVVNFNGEIHCGLPSASVFEFNGYVSSGNKNTQIGSENFIPSGSIIKNTQTVYGIVTYTGSQTKISMSSIEPEVKRTKLEKFLNNMSLWIFISQIIISIIVGTVSNIWNLKNHAKYPYLEITEYKFFWDWVILYVRFFLLTTTMIPISLKVTLDVCKFIYKVFIERDNYISKTSTGENKHTVVSNTSVIEDLGTIEYVFSDKTGTITENVLEFVKIAIDGKIYGEKSNIKEEKDFVEDYSNQNELNQNLLELVNSISLCHTLNITNSSIIGPYQEEIAFITRLREIGIQLEQQIDTTGSTIAISGFNLPVREFEVLHCFDFTFDRKCMSVLVRDKSTGEVSLRIKGAGERLAELSSGPYESYLNQMSQLATLGLRVMGVGDRLVSPDELRSIEEELQRITTTVNSEQKAAQLSELYGRVERGFVLRGLVGIEDRLQEGVGDTIALLQRAGIRVWMITGDIMPTAIKIAHSSQLFTNEFSTLNLTNTKVSIGEALRVAKTYAEQVGNDRYYLAFQCSALDELMMPANFETFKSLAVGARAVVVSRATPGQKKDIVAMIKSEKMTLAIGDGGNDVSMIREANVGVGISGYEGNQAANAADFKISQFSFLGRLLLVHGRYSNYRTSWLSQFCFYKSTVLCLIQLSYMFVSGYSGQSFFSSFNLMMYNAIYTFFPVIFFVQDKDIEESSIFLHPSVYRDTQRGLFCNGRTMFWWYMRGIYQAVMCFIGWYFVYTGHYFDSGDGNSASLDEAQQSVYSVLIMIVLITVTFDTKHFTALSLMFIWGSWVVYFVIAMIASSIPNLGIVKDEYLVMYRVGANATSLVMIITTVSMCITPPFFIKSISAKVWPTRTEQIRTKECSRQCVYQPIYLVQKPGDKENVLREPPLSIWEHDSNLCACCCKNHMHD